MIDYFFVFSIAVLGFIIVREDMMKGKIRNALVAAGVIGGLFLFGIGFLWSLAVRFDVISEQYMFFPLSYFSDVFVNFFISAVCGYLLWHYKVWSAGDAKFFIMLALLLPLQFYKNGYLSYFPSSALLVNIFIPIFIFFIFQMIVETATHFRKFLSGEIGFLRGYIAKLKREAASMMRHGRRPLILCGTFLLTFLFIPLLKYQTIMMLPPDFILVFSVFAAFYILQSYSYRFIEIFMKKKWFVAGLLFFIVGYLAVGTIYFMDSMIFALRMIVTVGAIFFVILSVFERVSDFYIRQKEVVIVPLEKIGEKMVIAEELTEHIKSDARFSREFGELHPEGISREQVVLLRRWLKERGKEHVPVYRTFSFAPYIFAGAIITVIMQQSILHLALSAIR